MPRIDNPIVTVGIASTGCTSGEMDHVIKIQKVEQLGKEQFLELEGMLRSIPYSITFKWARERLELPEKPAVYCHDCKTEMVKTFVEHDDGSGWLGCWSCECKPDPEVININKE